MLTVEPATAADVPAILGLAGEVEHWFGPMVAEPGFHRALRDHIGDGDVVEVVTFGEDHPGAADSGARVFYERLGFVPAEAAEAGPEGGSRQVFRFRPKRSETVRFST